MSTNRTPRLSISISHEAAERLEGISNRSCYIDALILCAGDEPIRDRRLRDAVRRMLGAEVADLPARLRELERLTADEGHQPESADAQR